MTVGHTLGIAEALVDTLADTVLEIEELSKGKTRGGSQALVNALADTLAEVEAVTPAKTRGGRVVSRRHTGRCGGIGRRSG